MEKIYEPLSRTKRNSFQTFRLRRKLSSVPDLWSNGEWMTRGAAFYAPLEAHVKKAILGYLNVADFQVSCDNIFSHLYRESQIYADFGVWFTFEEFVALCLKDLAVDGFLKLTTMRDTSLNGFYQRKVVCFVDPARVLIEVVEQP